MHQRSIQVSTSGRGLNLITEEILSAVGSQLPETGLVNIFVHHTSASLTIQENADPMARQDLEQFLERLAPDGEPWHRHTHEGPDDTTSHMKSVLTSTSVVIPITKSKLALGTWQGVYLWEHRLEGQTRWLTITVMGA